MSTSDTVTVQAIYFPPAGAAGSPARAWTGCRMKIDAANVRKFRADATSPTIEAVAQIAAKCLTIAPQTVLIGYSLGGLIAHELVRALMATGRPLPGALVIMGSRPPHVSTRSLFNHLQGLEGTALVGALTNMGALDQSILKHPALSLILRPLRRDCDLLARYEPAVAAMRNTPLDVPVVAMTGSGDPLVRPQHGRQWAIYTRSSFRHVVIDGDHQFPMTAGPAVGSVLAGVAERVLR